SRGTTHTADASEDAVRSERLFYCFERIPGLLPRQRDSWQSQGSLTVRIQRREDGSSFTCIAKPRRTSSCSALTTKSSPNAAPSTFCDKTIFRNVSARIVVIILSGAQPSHGERTEAPMDAIRLAIVGLSSNSC